MRPGPSPLAIWAGMITLYVVWGTTYLGIAVVIETIPPYVMVAIRFLVAGLLLPLLLLRWSPLPASLRRKYPHRSN